MSPVLPFDSDSVENFYEVLDAVMGVGGLGLVVSGSHLYF